MKKTHTLLQTQLDELLHTLHVRMEVEHFSNSSINCYLHSVKQLCLFTGSLPDQLTETDIYNYLLFIKSDKGLSRETIRNHLQGIRFMYKRIYKRFDIVQDIPYPKHTKKLPVILSSDELKLLFSATKCLKHQIMLKIAYGGGLRRNEICNLKLVDIDSKNNLLRIENSKGNKDRYTLLAPGFVPDLRNYCKGYQPKKYLFNGRIKGLPFSEGVFGGHLVMPSKNQVFKNK